jgi:OOP family OmpA-OmpF porin
MENYTNSTDKSPMLSNNELIKSLINGGYVATYFDFDKSPTNVSTEGIDFILTYLRNNPSASVDIIGHADELEDQLTTINYLMQEQPKCKSILIKANISLLG